MHDFTSPVYLPSPSAYLLLVRPPQLLPHLLHRLLRRHHAVHQPVQLRLLARQRLRQRLHAPVLSFGFGGWRRNDWLVGW